MPGEAGARFGRERRIRRRADFLRVQSLGQRASTSHFVLLVAARTEPGCARLGVVVTRKVGNAVARNRVKRLCRECFRTWAPVGFVPDGIDLVVIAKAGAPELGLADVRAQWERARPVVLKRCASATRPPHDGSPEAPTAAGSREPDAKLAGAPPGRVRPGA